MGESIRDYTDMAAHPAWGPLTYPHADSVDHENHRLAHSPIQPENDHNTDDEALRRTVAHYVAPVQEFFDVFVKGERLAELLPRVGWHLGRVGFRTSTRWPLPEACEVVLHLAAPDLAVRDAGGGSLHENPGIPADPPRTVRWTHDPHHLVPSITGDSRCWRPPVSARTSSTNSESMSSVSSLRLPGAYTSGAVAPDRALTDFCCNGTSGCLVAQLLCTPGIELPAAAMFTTIADLHRFTEMLRRSGEIGGVRILSPAMLRYSTRNYTGTMRNRVWDSILSSRHWQPTPAALGLGFHVRGEQPLPGQSRFGALNSPRAFGGFGAGSTGCRARGSAYAHRPLLGTVWEIVP
ncbi:hypothetical protein [Streptomyces sp. NPDC051572]|uniref:hypothetical protein n=1 Tax=unclassified Streptomyces TaxID=2593676 RepID=UPI00344E3CE5